MPADACSSVRFAPFSISGRRPWRLTPPPWPPSGAWTLEEKVDEQQQPLSAAWRSRPGLVELACFFGPPSGASHSFPSRHLPCLSSLAPRPFPAMRSRYPPLSPRPCAEPPCPRPLARQSTK